MIQLEKEVCEDASIKVINLAIMQIIMDVNEICGDENRDIANKIADAIDEHVRSPLNGMIS